ncbi:MAG: SDR family oxidoreductase [Bdellovibrionota bacterium]
MKPTAIVTGASSGIGAEYARAFARRGKHDLWLVARRLDRLETLKAELQKIQADAGHSGCSVETIGCDLGSPSARAELCRRLSDLENIEFLVNNAGFGSYTSLLDSDVARELEMIHVNCDAPLELCRAALPRMVRNKRGRIINVCSTAAFLPIPYMSTYCGTKALLLNLSLALGAEVRKHGVTVLAHCPGPTVSEFHAAAGLKQKLRHIPAMATDVVVSQALAASEAGKSVLINGLRNRVLVAASRIVPLGLTAWAVERKLRADMARISAERDAR